MSSEVLIRAGLLLVFAMAQALVSMMGTIGACLQMRIKIEGVIWILWLPLQLSYALWHDYYRLSPDGRLC